MIAINSNLSVHISQPGSGASLQDTGFKVCQRADKTVVYSIAPDGTSYAEHDMPHARYSLAHDAPRPMHATAELAARYPAPAGRAQFEADIRALLDSFHL